MGIDLSFLRRGPHRGGGLFRGEVAAGLRLWGGSHERNTGFRGAIVGGLCAPSNSPEASQGSHRPKFSFALIPSPLRAAHRLALVVARVQAKRWAVAFLRLTPAHPPHLKILDKLTVGQFEAHRLPPTCRTAATYCWRRTQCSASRRLASVHDPSIPLQVGREWAPQRLHPPCVYSLPGHIASKVWACRGSPLK